jgi:hypothetical protein
MTLYLSHQASSILQYTAVDLDNDGFGIISVDASE